MFDRRQFLSRTGAGVGLAALGLPASAQSLESAKIVVGFVPGGISDIVARRVADKLRGQYAGSVVVENKPGAAGQIAVTQVKDSTTDGSSLLLTHSSALSMYPYTYARLPYRPMEDLLPVSLTCHTNHALCVGPLVPASVKNVKDFLAWAKANPDKANYGSPGPGSMPHLIMTVVNKLSGSDVQHITYRGTAAAITDMLGSQVSAVSGPVGNFLPYVRAGKARLIAISGLGRSSFVPDTATYRQQGYPMTAREWYGIFLPSRTKPEIVRRASAYMQTALADPALVSSLAQSGLEVASSTPAALTAMLEADTQEWKRLIKQIGFNAES
ncbi:MAG: twin-arginine translocation signal domain-containing protein [Burkholderiales bacterium]|nr:twin-arginine translocation signal domain-containing protein [Burkholderiales bacterium]